MSRSFDLVPLDKMSNKQKEKVVAGWLEPNALTLPQLEGLARWLERRVAEAGNGRTVALAFVGTYVAMASTGVAVFGLEALIPVGIWLVVVLGIMGGAATWMSRVATRSQHLLSQVDMQRVEREEVIIAVKGASPVRRNRRIWPFR